MQVNGQSEITPLDLPPRGRHGPEASLLPIPPALIAERCFQERHFEVEPIALSNGRGRQDCWKDSTKDFSMSVPSGSCNLEGVRFKDVEQSPSDCEGVSTIDKGSIINPSLFGSSNEVESCEDICSGQIETVSSRAGLNLSDGPYMALGALRDAIARKDWARVAKELSTACGHSGPKLAQILQVVSQESRYLPCPSDQSDDTSSGSDSDFDDVVVKVGRPICLTKWRNCDEDAEESDESTIRLSGLLAVQTAGWRSLGSYGHVLGDCKTCVFENRHMHIASAPQCWKGVLCEYCHDRHPPLVRRHHRAARTRRAQQNGNDYEF